MNRRSFLRTAGTALATTPLLGSLGTAYASGKDSPAGLPPTRRAPDTELDNAQFSPRHISLEGAWSFRLDASGKGVNEHWFEQIQGSDKIFLPGSTDQAGYGDKVTKPVVGHLSRPYTYAGPAWYQKQFTIPGTWQGRQVSLFLERCHWQTSVWVDGKSYGIQDSLSAPHIYDFGNNLPPGKHVLTICVDNTIKIELGGSAHSISENTQTNWNGIVGRIELRSTPPVYVSGVRALTDPQSRTVKFEVAVTNSLTTPVSGQIEVALRGGHGSAQAVIPSFTGNNVLIIPVTLSDAPRVWDDVDACLYVAELRMKAIAENDKYEHRMAVPFGIRSISTNHKKLLLNGSQIFLRGTVENAVFPITAYPPMGIDEWREIFQVVRDYGMNHLRFHSWCPPEAAFAAADEAGVLLHVELPVFSHHVDTTPGLKEFMRREGHRIIATYGNHPSFTLLCMGNELTGDFPFLDQLAAELKQADSRRLYTYSTNNGRKAPGPTSDYWVTEETEQGRLRIDKTRFGAKPGGTDYDFSKAIAECDLPVIAHELGQWTVYPNYDEIGKYTGVLKPLNLEVFRDQLAQRNMADQAEEFQIASGRFAAEIYKEDIESALRTRDLGGFQLLQLTDYPGQQEAPVGILDCFWDTKQVMTAEAFRRFCNDTVPLCSFPKFVWNSGEIFRGSAQLAHYGKRQLRQSMVTWRVKNDSGELFESGTLRSCSAAPGTLASLGNIEFPLASVRSATRLTITLQIGHSVAVNSWHIWVYPSALSVPDEKNVIFTTSLDDGIMKNLEAGATVFLCAQPANHGDHLQKLRFLPVFWSFSMFKKQPGVLGILCDPKHPSLASFPTEMHGNWQWWELLEGTNAFILDNAPAEFRPVVQVIDDFHRNQKLGLVIEARVGNGKLLATSLPLSKDAVDKPVGRQLFYSLLRYAGSDRFNPAQSLSSETVRQLVC
jgi:hypothetical protein